MKKFAILAIIFAALEAADGFVTLWGTNNGIPEANPLFAPFAHTWALPLVKIAFGVLVAWGLYQVGRRFPKARRLAGIGLATGVGIQVVVMALWGLTLVIA